MEQHITAFFESFIAKRYKQQWLAALAHTQPVHNIIRGMDALPSELDERYCLKLPKGNKEQDIKVITQAITSYKLTTCWVLSTRRDFNGKSLPITEALVGIVGSSSTSIISFLPGKIAYFEGHSAGERYLCIKNV